MPVDEGKMKTSEGDLRIFSESCYLASFILDLSHSLRVRCSGVSKKHNF